MICQTKNLEFALIFELYTLQITQKKIKITRTWFIYIIINIYEYDKNLSWNLRGHLVDIILGSNNSRFIISNVYSKWNKWISNFLSW